MAGRPQIGRRHFSTEVRFNQFIWDLPDIIAGRKRRHTTAQRRVYNAFWSAVIQTLFIELHHAYEQKMMLQPDDNGTMWAQQTREYRAYKREKRGHLTNNQRKKYVADTPGLLTPHQFNRWKKTFRKVYRREISKSKGQGSDIEAKAKAARIAWDEAKKKGAETLLGTLGNQFYPILHFTGELFDSFTPGKVTNLKYNKGNRNQIARLKNGYAEIGTRVKHAEYASRTINRVVSKRDKGMLKARGIDPEKASYKVRRDVLPKDLGVFYDRAITAGRDFIAIEIKKLARENRLFS